MVYARKYAKKAKKAVKRRYFKGGKYRKPNIYRMARDLSLVRGMLNSEKKIYSIDSGEGNSYPLGQVNVNSSGHFIVGFTPNLIQGTQNNERVGSQVKFTSFHLDLQLWSQASAISGNKFVLEIWNIDGQYDGTLSNFMSDVYTPNVFTTGGISVYDLTSNRNVDNFKNYKCVYRKRLYLPPEDQSGQVSMRTFQLGHRYGKQGHMVRWVSPNSPTVTSGYQVLVIRADQGNAGASTTSIAGIPTQQPYTGAWVKYNMTHYYIDN